MQRWGRVDVLVNSAGKGPRAPVLELTDADWHAGMDAYLLNVVRAARCVTPIMVQQGGGAIVNISSAWAFEPVDLFPTSAVARAGLASFTKLFVDEYARHNVRMNNVLPGWINSLPEKTSAARPCPCSAMARWKRLRGRLPFWPAMRGLYQRPEHPRGWWADAFGVNAAAVKDARGLRRARACNVPHTGWARSCGATMQGKHACGARALGSCAAGLGPSVVSAQPCRAVDAHRASFHSVLAI
ncbi:2-dehydro-3-deoxy-D-gluconate 5-dehydrogenase [Comamonas aquatica]|nr:2-dehydro-3-deoxy-D-gluconate 5-dehydrogenase [Comamonas aquatica]